MVVYNACVVSTLKYGSETWTTYARQEKRFNSFHLRSIRRILGISWQGSVQRRGPVPSQPSKHVHPTQTAQAASAGSCLPHGGWPHPKRHSLWRVDIRKDNQVSPTTMQQMMSARETWKHSTLTLSPGRTLQPTAWGGEALWTNTSNQGKRSWWTQK